MPSVQKNRTSNIIVVDDPGLLPDDWDRRFISYPLMCSEFLKHLQGTNPVFQKYFWENSSENDGLAGCLCRIPVPFALGKITFFVPGIFCSIPMSFGFEPAFTPLTKLFEVVKLMDRQGPGLQMILGLDEKSREFPGWSWKRHYQTVDIPIKYKNFDDYLGKLRHVYRYPVIKSLAKWKNIEVKINRGGEFTQQDYLLHLSVLGKKGRGYRPLPIEFFRNLPLDHAFIKAYLDGKVIGWIVLIAATDVLYPLFVGIDYEHNGPYDTYNNLFIETIKYAIDAGFALIKTGQTSEIAKIRLGGIPREKYFLARHTNPLINMVINKTDILNYRKKYKPFHVFKT